MDIELLIQRYLAGEADDDDRVFLRQELARDTGLPEKIFREARRTEEIMAALDAEYAEEPACCRPRSIPAGVKMLLAAAAGIMIVFSVGLAGWCIAPPSATTGVVVVSAEGIALEKSATIAAGDLLNDDWHHLEKGLLILDFLENGNRHARAAMEGPADFRVMSITRMRLNEGIVTVKVDGAPGRFTIDAPTVSVRDLGTRFGVKVPRNGRVEVHVFAGRTELRPIAANEGAFDPLILPAGDAAAITGADGAAAVERGAADVAGFSLARVDAGGGGAFRAAALYPAMDLTVQRDGAFIDRELCCGGRGGNPTERAFLYFDLSSLDVTSDTLIRARLKMMLNSTEQYASVATGRTSLRANRDAVVPLYADFDPAGDAAARRVLSGAGRGAVVGRVVYPWDMRTNLPTILHPARHDPPLLLAPAVAGGDGKTYGPPRLGMYYHVDMTEIVGEWLRFPERNFGIRLSEPVAKDGTPYTWNNRRFASSRSAYPPQLIIEWKQ